jgi:hypothetical protein
MISENRMTQTCWLLLVAILGATSLDCAQTTGDGNVLNSPADESVAIRLFFQPPGDYFHAPLIFRVVDQKDPRLNTAPILDSGRTVHISLSEMQQLLPAVTHLRLLWRQAEIVEVLGSSRVLGLAITMDITIVSSHGTARAALGPKNICAALSPMDSALKSPRALWEFQLFRLGYGCKVPGFDYDAYPKRMS